MACNFIKNGGNLCIKSVEQESMIKSFSLDTVEGKVYYIFKEDEWAPVTNESIYCDEENNVENKDAENECIVIEVVEDKDCEGENVKSIEATVEYAKNEDGKSRDVEEIDAKYGNVEDDGVENYEIEDGYVKDQNVGGECIEDVDVEGVNLANKDIEYRCVEDEYVEDECFKEEIVNDTIVKDNNPMYKCINEYVNGQIIIEELLKADIVKDAVKEDNSLEECFKDSNFLIEESTTEVDAKVKYFVKENIQYIIENDSFIEENNSEEVLEKFPEKIQDDDSVKSYNNNNVSDDSNDGKDEKEPPRCPSLQWVEFLDSRPFLVTTLPQETQNSFGCRRHPMRVFNLQDYFLEQREVKKKRSFFRSLPFFSKSPTTSWYSITNAKY